ncbi:MAG: hypothetical protein ABWZ25_00565 [Chitinophagaceae bacterium]
MDTITLEKDLRVIGKPVPDFPNGIKEAFDSLVDILPGGFEGRPYYGLSYMDGDKVVYHATAHEITDDEATRYNQTAYTIPKGDYLAVTIKQWHSKIDSIGLTFHSLMADKRADLSTPCVEWYKNDDEMVCMVRVKENVTVANTVDH